MKMLTIIAAAKGEETIAFQYKGKGEILLHLLLEHGVRIAHECGGMCVCTTCHVYVLRGAELLEPCSKREIDFLQRVSNRNAHSRLACQCLIIKDKGTIEIALPGNL